MSAPLDDDDIAIMFASKVKRAEGAPLLLREIINAISGALAFERAQRDTGEPTVEPDEDDVLFGRLVERGQEKLRALIRAAKMTAGGPFDERFHEHDIDVECLGKGRLDGGEGGQYWVNVPVYVHVNELGD